MRFKRWPQLPGAERTRVGHHHGSHTPTSPEAVLLGKMACQTKHFGRQCKSLGFTLKSIRFLFAKPRIDIYNRKAKIWPKYYFLLAVPRLIHKCGHTKAQTFYRIAKLIHDKRVVRPAKLYVAIDLTKIIWQFISIKWLPILSHIVSGFKSVYTFGDKSRDRA